MAVEVKVDACIACGACVDTCPAGALEMGDSCVEVNADECVDCGACISACPADALEL